MHSEDVTQVIASDRCGGLSLLCDKVSVLSGLELASIVKSVIRCLRDCIHPGEIFRKSSIMFYEMK